MVDNFEFSDAKKIRKSLLISSFVGIAFQVLVKNSTGNIEFLGFKIPIADADVIPNLIGYLIIYFIVALLIRYNDENLRKKYSEYIDYLKIENKEQQEEIFKAKRDFNRPLKDRRRIRNWQIIFAKFGVIFIDIIFPIFFGLFTIFRIFSK